MEKDQQRMRKRKILVLLQAGHSLQEALATEENSVCRSTAYRLLREFQACGEDALHDGRHGHPAKLCKSVRQWLVTTCRPTPQMPSRELQTAVQKHFGVLVSIGHLNRVRAELGIANRVGRQKKNSIFRLFRLPPMKPNGKKVRGLCFSLPPRTKRDCSQH